jgi:hypothetical protein
MGTAARAEAGLAAKIAANAVDTTTAAKTRDLTTIPPKIGAKPYRDVPGTANPDADSLDQQGAAVVRKLVRRPDLPLLAARSYLRTPQAWPAIVERRRLGSTNSFRTANPVHFHESRIKCTPRSAQRVVGLTDRLVQALGGSAQASPATIARSTSRSPRSRRLPAQDRQLVPEHQDLGFLRPLSIYKSGTTS